jgi:hypothetical protein
MLSKRGIIMLVAVFAASTLLASEVVVDYPANRWELPITVSSDHLSMDLVIGENAKAVDGLDAIDIPACPPPPGAPAFYSYLSSSEGHWLFDDIRPAGENCWELVVRNTEDKLFDISWDSSNLPPDGYFYYSGIDMRHMDRVVGAGTWNERAQAYEYCEWIEKCNEPLTVGWDYLTMAVPLPEPPELPDFAETFDIAATDILFEVDANETKTTVPQEYELLQNYPNPFNPETNIGFTIPEPITVNVTVFNVLGQVITELIVDEYMDAGYHTVTWDASHVASGVYFYRFEAGEFTATMRMVLMK